MRRKVLKAVVVSAALGTVALVVMARGRGPTRFRLMATTWAGWSRARTGPKQASGSSPRRRDLPTKLARIVVTDDRGRYVVPDLPKANYTVLVRGYGLVDSPKVQAAPGRTLNLTAVVAPNPRAAAQYYPAGYWASLLRDPREERVPRHRAAGQWHLAGDEEPGACGSGG